VPLTEGGTSWVHLHTWNDYYELTIVDEEGFKKQLTFSAREMKEKLDQEGHVAIYGIHFDFDKADLKVGSEKVLTEMVKLMKDNLDLAVEIQGHTDNVGGQDYNLDLSEKRAQTVKAFLSLYGVETNRMTVKGYGFGQPVASNDTEEGRALNRRVELKKR
jgi:OOP family OmpA-OmpF porin